MFPLFDEATAPEAARPILIKTRKEFRMIPNLERTMALAPTLLESYATCWNLSGFALEGAKDKRESACSCKA